MVLGPPPYKIVQQVKPTFKVTGGEINAVKLIGEKLGVNLKIYPAKGWGIKINGKWTGLMGQMVNGEVITTFCTLKNNSCFL